VRPLLALALVCLVAAPALAAPDLEVGDAAPALSDVQWLKGEPVPGFGDGRVYVLDFWATWCGPCVRSIPHVNALANSLAEGVTIIGVAIWPRPEMTPTAEFVEKRGEAMNYTIAEDIDAKTADAFMKAAGRKGLPTAMIVDGSGILSWIGHPMAGMDEALKEILDGTFDRVAWAEQAAREAALRESAKPLQSQFHEAFKAGRFADAAATAKELVALDDAYAYYAVYAYQSMSKDGRWQEALSYALEATRGPMGQDATALNWLSWEIVAPGREGEPSATELDLALVAATKANELGEHRDPQVLDTLARVHWRRGNAVMAAMLQQRAVEMATDERRPGFQKVLDEYRGGAG